MSPGDIWGFLEGKCIRCECDKPLARRSLDGTGGHYTYMKVCYDCRALDRRKRYAGASQHEVAVIRRSQKKVDPDGRKLRARSMLKYHVKVGHIIKPDICSNCQEPRPRIEGHHGDYSKPLEVIWLCKRCHSVADREDVHSATVA